MDISKKVPNPQGTFEPKNYRYPKPFARQNIAQDVLSNWRKDPKWIVPAGYADYSSVNQSGDGMFYIDVSIRPSLHAGTECNSYLMAATG